MVGQVARKGKWVLHTEFLLETFMGWDHLGDPEMYRRITREGVEWIQVAQDKSPVTGLPEHRKYLDQLNNCQHFKEHNAPCRVSSWVTMSFSIGNKKIRSKMLSSHGSRKKIYKKRDSKRNTELIPHCLCLVDLRNAHSYFCWFWQTVQTRGYTAKMKCEASRY